MKNHITLINNIKLVRKFKGFSQEKIASKLYITQACYNKLEIGQTKMTEDYANKIADILDVSLDVLMHNDLKQEFLKILNKNSSLCLNT